VKLGSRRTFVGCLPASAMWYSSGTGMFDADSLSRCKKVVVSYSVCAFGRFRGMVVDMVIPRCSVPVLLSQWLP
jgi:hypothetical protein